ncbi:MAG: SsrA-binding protein, partial [Clostridia bacterium]|nr:SsrA-binding protein [Clostridia bacterium]
MKVIAVNKSASFEYFIEEKYEAGIVLEGNEIKSLRDGAVNMNDSFCFVRGNVVCVRNMHVALYDKSDAFSTKDTRRDRKLLLHKKEIAKIAG